jgi:SAM-dependent methyltransferase
MAALEQPLRDLPVPDSAQDRWQRERIAYWDSLARNRKQDGVFQAFYRRRLAEIYRFLVPPGSRVLELGCGRGDLLASLASGVGVGVDFSPEMVRQARARHPHLHFHEADVHDLALDEEFDFVILSDLVNELWNVQQVLERLAPLLTGRTRVVLNFHSRVWHLPLHLASKLGLAAPRLPQNWLTTEDVANLLHLSGLEVIHSWPEILWPVPTPLLARFANRVLAKLWPFRLADLSNFVVARPQPKPLAEARTVSVIVPARNEAGNIAQIFQRVPEMGLETELVFVEGHSSDDTYAAIQRAMAANPHRPCQLLRQTGEGKGDAVRLGFARARGDVLMILDADLTVPPEDLRSVYSALTTGKGEFVNCVRLVYPMEKSAMRFLNMLGNKFFSLAFSFLLGQPIKDTLCGTKALFRSSYEVIAANRATFGDFDPFGDFDLLFGAAKLNLKIVDFPIRYRERQYGTTNIRRWRHGWLLLNMVIHAARKLKFV